MTRRRRRGQALAEFALVIPIFLLMLFGIIDIGRYVYTANAMGNGAREGARAGSVGVRPSPVCDGLSRQNCVIAVARANSWGVAPNTITTTVTCERPIGTASGTAVASCRTNDGLRVRNATNFTLVTPLIAQFLGSLQITGETVVAVNQ